jgi:hypothetical protein
MSERRARCQTCQTYGSRTNPLFEIAVDDNEGIFQCADCLHTDNARYGYDAWEVDPPLRMQGATPTD